MGVNSPGGTWPPIAGAVPGTAAPQGMAQAGGDGGGIDPMALMAMAKLARGTKARKATRPKAKAKRK